MRNTALTFAVALSFVIACDKPAGTTPDAPKVSGVPKAVIADAAPASAAAVGKTFTVDQGGTIGYVGAKVTGTHAGDFPKYQGEIVVGESEASSSVKFTIDMDSVTADGERLLGHLKSADFFDTATHKLATFTSTKIIDVDGGAGTHNVTGNFELRGVTKQITFPATIAINGDKASVDAKFSIDRKAWGIVYPGKVDDLIKDDVEITLKLTATAPAPLPPG